MTCESVREAVDAFIDDELQPAVRAEIAAHLRECAPCARERDGRMALRARVRGADAGYAVPDLLVARVRAAAAALPESPAARGAWSVRRAGWFGFAGGIAAAALLLAIWNALPVRATVDDDLLRAHLASLRGRLTDVVSTDQHNVKPWFNGRVDLSPPVPDLSAAGFSLVGGRVDTVGGRAVAVVVYGVRKHLINVFVWPGSGRGDSSPAWSTRNGYHFAAWRHDGLELRAVSDVNEAELGGFVASFRSP